MVAGLHVFALTSHPIKDDFWWTFLYSRVFVDAVTILGLGIGLKYLNSQNTKEVVKNMKGITMEGGWENIFWVAPIIVMAIGPLHQCPMAITLFKVGGLWLPLLCVSFV